MADVLAPPRPEPKRYGNDPAHLRSCLERGGFFVLLRMVERGELTAHGAAVEAGIRQGREPLGSGSENRARERAWKINKAYQEAELAGVPLGAGDLKYWQDDAEPAPRVAMRPGNGASHPRRAAWPDLSAALAEAEMMRRTTDLPETRDDLIAYQRDKELVRQRNGRGHRRDELGDEDDLRRDERALFPGHPALPCCTCSHPSAPAAMREVFASYVAGRRGESQTGNTLPPSCCQRQLRVVDVRALVG